MKKKKNISCSEELDIWKKIVEDIPFSLQTYAPDGLCLTCNKAWEKLWKSPRSQAINRYNLLKDPQLEQRHIAHYYLRAFKGESVFLPAVPYISPEKIKSLVGKPLGEFLQRKKLKRTYVDVWLYPIKNKRGKIVRGVIVHQDVTKRILQDFGNVERMEELKAEIKKMKEIADLGGSGLDKLKELNG